MRAWLASSLDPPCWWRLVEALTDIDDRVLAGKIQSLQGKWNATFCAVLFDLPPIKPALIGPSMPPVWFGPIAGIDTEVGIGGYPSPIANVSPPPPPPPILLDIFFVIQRGELPPIAYV